MQTKIALLRGVNVGGKNKVAMKALRVALEAAGLGEVRSYIQSGNLVFRSGGDDDADRAVIGRVLADRFEVEASVFVLAGGALRQAVDGSPFPADSPPSSVHLAFCDPAPSAADVDELRGLTAPTETLHGGDAVLYLSAPDGVARSKLYAALTRQLPGAVTVRNLRTARKVLELAGG